MAKQAVKRSEKQQSAEVVPMKQASTSLATAQERNYFEQYGDQASQRNLVGQLLKFSKGDWLAGEDSDEVPVGTKLVAIMDQVMVGWVKWRDNRPEQQHMGLIVEGFQPPRRSDLGDTNDSDWELDDRGQPRDPWQFTNYVVMKEPGKKMDMQHMYTFATSSRGGIGAVGQLCQVYGKGMRERPDEYPVVALKVSAYDHPKKEFGRIKVPVLEVVGWEKKQK